MRAVTFLLSLTLLAGCLDAGSGGGADGPDPLEEASPSWDGTVHAWNGGVLNITLPAGHAGGGLLLDVSPEAWRPSDTGDSLTVQGTIRGVANGTWVGLLWLDVTEGAPRFLGFTHDAGNRTFERDLAFDLCAGHPSRILMTIVAEAPLPEFEVRMHASDVAAPRQAVTAHGRPGPGFVGIYREAFGGGFQVHNMEVDDTRGGDPAGPGTGALRALARHDGGGFHYAYTASFGGGVSMAGEWSAVGTPDGEALRTGGTYHQGAGPEWLLLGAHASDFEVLLELEPITGGRPFWNHYVGVVPIDERMVEAVGAPEGWARMERTPASVTNQSPVQTADGCAGGSRAAGPTPSP